MKQTLPNLRFWEHINNGFVKITLKAGQPLRWHKNEQHDEGYSSSRSTYEMHTKGFGGDNYPLVRLTEESYSIDCDGPHSSEDTYHANAWELKHKRSRKGICIPKWEHVGGKQRDHYAEAMGY